MLRTLFLVVGLALTPAAQGAEAGALIATFHEALTGLAAGQATDFDTRAEALAAIVDATHDLEYIARLTLGMHWNELDDAQRADFVERFRRLSIATYASRFEKLSDEQFQVIEELEQPRGRRLVRAQLHLEQREPLAFDYVLRETADGWRIVNILVDGVSDLALKRAEYAKQMNDADFNALLRLLDEQAAQQSKAD